MAEPVVGGHFSSHRKDHAAQGKTLIGIGIHTPIAAVNVFLHGADGIDHGCFLVTDPAVSLPIDDVGTSRREKLIFHQGALDKILDLLDPKDALHRRTGNIG